MTSDNPAQIPLVFELSYALSRHIPELHARGLTIVTAYGEFHLEPADAGAAIQEIELAVTRLLARTLRGRGRGKNTKTLAEIIADLERDQLRAAQIMNDADDAIRAYTTLWTRIEFVLADLRAIAAGEGGAA